MQHFSINLMGDGGVGKTAWVRKIKNNVFEKRYFATVGTEINQIIIRTNYGPILVDLWEYAGQEKYTSKTYHANNATILMFDLTSPISHKNLKHWYEKSSKTGPIIIIGNKCDCEDIKVVPTFHEKYDLQYISLSAKNMSESDIMTPILRRLTGKDDLDITE